MIVYIRSIIKALTLKPKKVFLIDAFGAALTTVFLNSILKTYNEYFGMPIEILTVLSILAFVLAIYSFSCFVLLENNTQNFLIPIIVANLSYCILTIGIVTYYYNKITILGLAYFVGEILLICLLVYIELKTLEVSRQNKSK